MIEFLNARRMIAVIGVLILLCIIIVILEDSIADTVDKPTPYLEHVAKSLARNTSASPHTDSRIKHLHASCWTTEKFTVEAKCSPCSVKEMQLPACIATGYKEHLHCDTTGHVFRSCDSSALLFWMFQFFMLCLSFVFNFYVKQRQTFLNRMILDRIEKQIASGV